MGLEKGDQKLIFLSGYVKYDCSSAWVEAVLLVIIHLACVLLCMLSQEACKMDVKIITYVSCLLLN